MAESVIVLAPENYSSARDCVYHSDMYGVVGSEVDAPRTY